MVSRFFGLGMVSRLKSWFVAYWAERRLFGLRSVSRFLGLGVVSRFFGLGVVSRLTSWFFYFGMVSRLVCVSDVLRFACRQAVRFIDWILRWLLGGKLS